MIDPVSGLIGVARKKVLAGKDTYTAYAASCSCYVEVSALSPPTTAPISGLVMQSTRERYSRCVEHKR